jgi:excisionase family DNA binding protein
MADRRPEVARIDPRRAKVHRSYTVAEAARLFGVHRNTVRNWVKSNLPVIGEGRTLLILGRDLGPFLARRQTERRRKCGPGQLYCLRCREPRRPREGSLRVLYAGSHCGNLAALCETCGTRMHRRASLGKLAATGFSAVKEDEGSEEHSR